MTTNICRLSSFMTFTLSITLLSDYISCGVLIAFFPKTWHNCQAVLAHVLFESKFTKINIPKYYLLSGKIEKKLT